MQTPDAPHAMVLANTPAQAGLEALGWTVTDTKDGWAHMEPPSGPAVLIRRDPQQFEPEPGDPVYRPSIELRELALGERDMLVVTAEDCDAKDIEAVREQVDLALEDPDFAIVANFDIVMTVVRRPEINPPLYKHQCAVKITEVDDELVSGEVQGPLGTHSAQWLQLAFHEGPPKVGERLIMSTELRRREAP